MNPLDIWSAFILVGSWVNNIFYTVELIIFVQYLRRWSVSPAGYVFMLVITRIYQPWILALLAISTSLSILIEQTYMVHRYWRVTRNNVVCGFIMLMAVLLQIIAVGVTLVHYNDPHYPLAQTLSTASAIICTAANVLIVFFTIWSLSGINPVWRSTQHLVRAICVNTVTSGAVVATVTIFSLVSLLTNGITFMVFTLFYIGMGRVYSLTILINFITRNSKSNSVTNSLEISEIRRTSLDRCGVSPTSNARIRQLTPVEFSGASESVNSAHDSKHEDESSTACLTAPKIERSLACMAYAVRP
ncbi:hypothetical protein C8J57DRAFT_1314836 [Mycena rebaudengoi]|nr:hypothetical protein C8J57DRAFT_1314836 [Mycena rebaudengoi]